MNSNFSIFSNLLNAFQLCFSIQIDTTNIRCLFLSHFCNNRAPLTIFKEIPPVIYQIFFLCPATNNLFFNRLRSRKIYKLSHRVQFGHPQTKARSRSTSQISRKRERERERKAPNSGKVQ